MEEKKEGCKSCKRKKGLKGFNKMEWFMFGLTIYMISSSIYVSIQLLKYLF
jgi:hypothetical protein